MNRSFLVVMTVMVFGGVSAQPQKSKVEKPIANGPDLKFKEEGKDLLVSLKIDGPASRQIVLTEYLIDDGKPNWEEEMLRREKIPARKPHITLRYCVLINSSLPGFIEKGLMNVPTPQSMRDLQKNEVVWRLPNIHNWGFKREDALISVEATSFSASTDQLKQAIPQIQKTVDRYQNSLKNMSTP